MRSLTKSLYAVKKQVFVEQNTNLNLNFNYLRFCNTLDN
ncbi:hypothetical protein APA_3865 [Pseudanabaena sp. lw0831]|nr:hypothetical protein APA_3865 [Pseudanabaena sp. lw0831]